MCFVLIVKVYFSMYMKIIECILRSHWPKIAIECKIKYPIGGRCRVSQPICRGNYKAPKRELRLLCGFAIWGWLPKLNELNDAKWEPTEHMEYDDPCSDRGHVDDVARLLPTAVVVFTVWKMSANAVKREHAKCWRCGQGRGGLRRRWRRGRGWTKWSECHPRRLGFRPTLTAFTSIVWLHRWRRYIVDYFFDDAGLIVSSASRRQFLP